MFKKVLKAQLDFYFSQFKHCLIRMENHNFSLIIKMQRFHQLGKLTSCVDDLLFAWFDNPRKGFYIKKFCFAHQPVKTSDLLMKSLKILIFFALVTDTKQTVSSERKRHCESKVPLLHNEHFNFFLQQPRLLVNFRRPITWYI